MTLWSSRTTGSFDRCSSLLYHHVERGLRRSTDCGERRAGCLARDRYSRITRLRLASNRRLELPLRVQELQLCPSQCEPYAIRDVARLLCRLRGASPQFGRNTDRAHAAKFGRRVTGTRRRARRSPDTANWERGQQAISDFTAFQSSAGNLPAVLPTAGSTPAGSGRWTGSLSPFSTNRGGSTRWWQR